MEAAHGTLLRTINRHCLSVVICGGIGWALLSARDPMAQILGHGFSVLAGISLIAAARCFWQDVRLRRQLHVFRTQGAGLHTARWANECEPACNFDPCSGVIGAQF